MNRLKIIKKKFKKRELISLFDTNTNSYITGSVIEITKHYISILDEEGNEHTLFEESISNFKRITNKKTYITEKPVKNKSANKPQKSKPTSQPEVASPTFTTSNALPLEPTDNNTEQPSPAPPTIQTKVVTTVKLPAPAITIPEDLQAFQVEMSQVDMEFEAPTLSLLDKETYKNREPEENISLERDLMRIKQKYDSAIRQSDKHNRLEDLSWEMKGLEKKYFLNPYILYNHLFIKIELEEYQAALDLLNILGQNHSTFAPQNMSIRSLGIFLGIKSNKLPDCLFYFAKLLEDKNIVTDHQLFLQFVELCNSNSLYLAYNNLLKAKSSNGMSAEVEKLLLGLDFLLPNEKFYLQRLGSSSPNEKINLYTEILTTKIEKSNETPPSFIDVQKSMEERVPANAIVKRFKADRGFGFLKDNNNKEVFFNISQIIDDHVKHRLHSNSYEEMTVLCNIVKSDNGLRATNIHLPEQVGKILKNAKKFHDEEKTDISIGLCDQILEVFPNHANAQSMRAYFVANRPQNKPYRYALSQEQRRKNKSKNLKGSSSPLHKKAQHAAESENFEQAINLYKSLIKKGEKFESSVKNLASVYQRVGDFKKAIAVIEDNINNSLIKNRESTLNHFSNILYAAKEYQKSADILKELLTLSSEEKKIEIYKRIAGCYVKLKDHRSANLYLELVFAENKNDTFAKKLYTIIQTNELNVSDSELDEELDEMFYSNSISVPDLKLSQLIGYDLEKSDYVGLKDLSAKSAKSEEISEKDLKDIKDFLKREGGGRSLKIGLLLTKAKILNDLQSEDIGDFKYTLMQYCFAKGDMYRTGSETNIDNRVSMMYAYYLESFKLAKTLKHVLTPFIEYLISFITSNNPAVEKFIQKDEDSTDHLINTRIKEILEFLVTNELDNLLWHQLLEVSIYNSTILENIKEHVYNSSIIRTGFYSFVKRKDYSNQGIETLLESTETEFEVIWESSKKGKQIELQNWVNNVKSLLQYKQLEDIIASQRKIRKEVQREWLLKIDTNRLNRIFELIEQTLESFVTQSGYIHKERNKNRAKQEIESLASNIDENPTNYSIEIFLPVLEHLENLIDKDFNAVISNSEPKLGISILKNATAFDEKTNFITVQIGISNGEGCAPIDQINLSVKESADCKLISQPYSYSEPIDGGEITHATLKLWVSDNEISKGATVIHLKGLYKSRIDEDPIDIEIDPLRLSLYPESEFQEIVNPYDYFREGGPVKKEDMFFGRKTLIENTAKAILNSPVGKSFIIYGQKRSGKTSVLHHLKKRLEKDEQSFCIMFSLPIGEISEERDFFSSILDNINSELKELQEAGIEVPEYHYDELEIINAYYPKRLFRQKMRDFHKSCKKLIHWKNKKLVLLIDEFTYLYTAILDDKLDKLNVNFLKTWKELLEESLFSVVMIGQDVTPKLFDLAPNAFGIIERVRLTYLSKKDAMALANDPIEIDIPGQGKKSRYTHEDTLKELLRYTSNNPYYIQIFCANLIDYLNQIKANEITIPDIKNVAESLFGKGEHSLSENKHFDNLLLAGDADASGIPKEDSLSVLKQIAAASSRGFSCRRDQITLKNDEYTNAILHDLVIRDVLVEKSIGEEQEKNYDIQVKLFQEWLNRH